VIARKSPSYQQTNNQYEICDFRVRVLVAVPAGRLAGTGRSRIGIPATYDDPEALMRNEELDFVDIITDVDSHARFV